MSHQEQPDFLKARIKNPKDILKMQPNLKATRLRGLDEKRRICRQENGTANEQQLSVFLYKNPLKGKFSMPHRGPDTHNLAIGYVCWLFGFTGAHRFYYGKPVTGIIWFLTLGLLGIGWIVDLFLMPSLHLSAERQYVSGELDYNVAWLLLTFLGVLGVHRMYTGRWITGIVWFLTGGLFLLGWLYDLCTLNDQIHDTNRLGYLPVMHFDRPQPTENFVSVGVPS